MDPLSCPYRVNGDDGVVVVNELGYEFWKKLSTAMGFPPSVGKVYYSSEFFDFNSRCFQPRKYLTLERACSGSLPEDMLALVRFVHVGLFEGKKRTGGDVELSDLMSNSMFSFGGLQRTLLRNCRYDQRLAIMAEFHAKVLMRRGIYEYIAGIPWFIPVSLGGLGLMPLYRDWLFSSSDLGTATYQTVMTRTRHPRLWTLGPTAVCTRISQRLVVDAVKFGLGSLNIPTLDLVGLKPVAIPRAQGYRTPVSIRHYPLAVDGVEEPLGNNSTDLCLWCCTGPSRDAVQSIFDEQLNYSGEGASEWNAIRTRRHAKRLRKFWGRQYNRTDLPQEGLRAFHDLSLVEHVSVEEVFLPSQYADYLNQKSVRIGLELNPETRIVPY